jgi:hypothetical protein
MPISVVPDAVQDWQDRWSYDCTAHLTSNGWAWEFLRRNPAFQRDLLAALQQANTLSRGALIDVIASTGDLSRWGVLFRRLSRTQCGCVLVSAPVRACIAGPRGTADRVAGAVRPVRIAMSDDSPSGSR